MLHSNRRRTIEADGIIDKYNPAIMQTTITDDGN